MLNEDFDRLRSLVEAATDAIRMVAQLDPVKLVDRLLEARQSAEPAAPMAEQSAREVEATPPAGPCTTCGNVPGHLGQFVGGAPSPCPDCGAVVVEIPSPKIACTVCDGTGWRCLPSDGGQERVVGCGPCHGTGYTRANPPTPSEITDLARRATDLLRRNLWRTTDNGAYCRYCGGRTPPFSQPAWHCPGNCDAATILADADRILGQRITATIVDESPSLPDDD